MTKRFFFPPLDYKQPPWYQVKGQTCLAAWRAIGAASLAASYTDLTGNGNNLTLGSAPMWTALTGWILDGANSYLKTGITFAAGYSVFIRFSNFSGADFLIGASNAGAEETSIEIDITTPRRIYKVGNGSYLKAAVNDAAGVVAIAGAKGYFDGTEEGTATPAAYAALELYLGARNLTGVANRFTDGRIQAAAIYSTTLSAAQVAGLSTVMAAL